MEEDLKSVLIDKKKNIGGLCLYLRKRKNLMDELDGDFNGELNKILTTSQKIWFQGFVGSKIKVGLFYKNELVSLMIFGNLKKHMDSIEKLKNFEMMRFCNKLNTSVVDGDKYLFDFFIEKHKPTKVVARFDKSWLDEDLYKKLDFSFVNKIEPEYHYIVGGIRENRFNYRKDKLIKEGFDPIKNDHQIMLERGIFRIYDSGSLKLEKLFSFY